MKSQQTLDRFEIRFSGLGGQGIITLGKVMGSGLPLDTGTMSPRRRATDLKLAVVQASVTSF